PPSTSYLSPLSLHDALPIFTKPSPKSTCPFIKSKYLLSLGIANDSPLLFVYTFQLTTSPAYVSPVKLLSINTTSSILNCVITTLDRKSTRLNASHVSI